MNRYSLLVVDDSPDNLRLMMKIFPEDKYLVRPVADGSLALSAAQADPPDLILLDILMPGVSGFEICSRLKSSESTRDIPVIFISAKDDPMDKKKALDLGAVDFISKPFRAEEIVTRVDTQLKLITLKKEIEKQKKEIDEQ